MHPQSLDLADLFRRDLNLFKTYIVEFSREEKLFEPIPGNKNSIGHLAQHLIGNLSHFILHILGHIPYERNRDSEFESEMFRKVDLEEKISELLENIPKIICSLTKEALDKKYPIHVFQKEMSIHCFLIHLYGHLNLHLGQIRYTTRYWDETPSS